MTTFTVHTKETAPEKSVAHLEGAEKLIGFIPNQFGLMAESPATIKAYMTISQIFDESEPPRVFRRLFCVSQAASA